MERELIETKVYGLYRVECAYTSLDISYIETLELSLKVIDLLSDLLLCLLTSLGETGALLLLYEREVKSISLWIFILDLLLLP